MFWYNEVILREKIKTLHRITEHVKNEQKLLSPYFARFIIIQEPYLLSYIIFGYLTDL